MKVFEILKENCANEVQIFTEIKKKNLFPMQPIFFTRAVMRNKYFFGVAWCQSLLFCLYELHGRKFCNLNIVKLKLFNVLFMQCRRSV